MWWSLDSWSWQLFFTENPSPFAGAFGKKYRNRESKAPLKDTFVSSFFPFLLFDAKGPGPGKGFISNVETSEGTLSLSATGHRSSLLVLASTASLRLRYSSKGMVWVTVQRPGISDPLQLIGSRAGAWGWQITSFSQSISWSTFSKYHFKSLQPSWSRNSL